MTRKRRRIVAVGVGLALVVVGTGVVLLRRADAGLVLRTVPVSWQPYDIAIDERTGRAFVIGYDQDTSLGPGGLLGPGGRLAVLDTASGARLRTVTLGDTPADMVVDEATGRVFITDNAAGTVTTVDARSGTLLRTVTVGQMGQPETQSIVVDARASRVFVSTTPVTYPDPSKSTVRVLDARTGAILRTVKTGGGSLAVDEQAGHVFVANFSSPSVSMLDARSGALLYTAPLSYAPYHLAVSANTGRVFVTGDRGVSMLDARTGQALRIMALSRANDPTPTVDEATKRLFVVDLSRHPPYIGAVRTFNARTGALIRTVTMVSPGIVAVDSRRGRIFVTTGNGMSVLDAHTGAILHAMGADGWPAIDGWNGRILVINGGAMDKNGVSTSPGSVSLRDARSGAVLASATIGWDPINVAIDERTGHAFVVNNGGRVHPPDPWAWVPSWLRQWLPFLPRPSSRTTTVPGSVSVVDMTR